jgi:hypothetical protein
MTSNNAFERTVDHRGAQLERLGNGAHQLHEAESWPAAQLGR